MVRRALYERFFKRNPVHRLDVPVRSGDDVHDPAVVILKGVAAAKLVKARMTK